MRLTLTDNLIIGFVVTSLCAPTLAYGHSWYPKDCCSDNDCAPVLSIKQVPQGRLVTSKHGTVLVPVDYKYIRPSQDSDFHVCMVQGDIGVSDMALLCFFEPSGS